MTDAIIHHRRRFSTGHIRPMAGRGRSRFERGLVRSKTGHAHLRRHRYSAVSTRSAIKIGTGDELGLPGAPPFVRGASSIGAVQTGWDLRQEHAHPDLAVTNRAILEDLEGGVTSILLRFDAAASCGLDPDDPVAAELVGSDGVAAYCVDDLDSVFAEVQLPLIGIALEAGAAFLPAAAALIALWRKRNVSPDRARGAFNADPLAVLAAGRTIAIFHPNCAEFALEFGGLDLEKLSARDDRRRRYFCLSPRRRDGGTRYCLRCCHRS